MRAEGLRLALSWLTVLPVRTDTVTATTCRRAIGLAPLVGVLLGVFAALVTAALTTLTAPPLLAGLVAVAALMLVTRGMHVDGFADTVDGLGCYGPPERALSVMRDGSTGPFAVAALVLVIGTQTVSFAALAAAGQWPAIVVACATGRAAFALCCRRGVPPARPDGMGALVAGSQPTWIVAAWWVALAALAAATMPATWWVGPIAVGVSGVVLVVFVRHARRRFGGVTGDVLGASSEIATTLTAVLAVLVLS